MLLLLAALTAHAGPAEDLAQASAGKAMVVSFWASWCGPCREDLRLLDDLSGRIDDDRAAVVTVNIDRQRRRGEAVLRKLDVDLAVVWDPAGEVAGSFDPAALPATYVVAIDGEVRQEWLGELDDADLREVEAVLAAES
jgi:thiol-disulfide isomerase/thioredoxin